MSDWRNKFSSPSRMDTFAMYLSGSYWGRKDKETGEDIEFTEELFVGELLKQFEKTPQMKAGTALHKILEDSQYQEELNHSVEISGEVYNFKYQIPSDIEIVLPIFREAKISKSYGNIVINGIVDAVNATTVWDHKLTKQIRLEKYMESWQWKIYLYMLGLDRFIYNLFQGSVYQNFHDIDNTNALYDINITKFEALKLERYPNMDNEIEDFYTYYWDVLEKLKPLIFEMKEKNEENAR